MAHDIDDDDDNDDMPQLPPDTLLLLDQFNSEKDARKKRFEDLNSEAENDFRRNDGKLTMELFGEDWNASQFWYTDHTAQLLAMQLLDAANEETSIALISAPSVYVAIRNILAEHSEAPRPKLALLEYDQRFKVIGPDFVQYDYQHPLRIPSELRSAFDRILCDPPFLSEDCQTKTALTARSLARDWSRPTASNMGLRMISCTGERMEAIITKLYSQIGIQTTTFEPEHTKGLSNEFRCYANHPSKDWSWR